MSHVFLLALEKGVPFRDGAMAALPHDRGVPPACPEAIDLESPDLVAAMHSEIIEISTFGAIGPPLNRHGLAGRVRGQAGTPWRSPNGDRCRLRCHASCLKLLRCADEAPVFLYAGRSSHASPACPVSAMTIRPAREREGAWSIMGQCVGWSSLKKASPAPAGAGGRVSPARG